ncbi:hypothetical protein [Nostoc sp.]|uniref:hypothetical protein n=1 Tax=Nostoc sp. TaxID=1180 RepID=UPI002FF5CDED
MNLLRLRMHHLIEQLGDDDLQDIWNVLEALHYDFYMLKAIQKVKRAQQPWDILTHEEAVRLLMFF